MFRLIGKVVLILLCVSAAVVGWVLFRSEDPEYTASNWLSLGRFDHFDTMIRDAAAKHSVDPLLLKAVVWRESEFSPEKVGGSGERGLMQVGEAAAADWVRVNKIETFVPTDLFAPRTNLEVGTWYLARALQRWEDKDDPVPFALAEYNAGKRRVDRWIERQAKDGDGSAREFITQIDFPTTRAYIDTILKRRAFYQRQARGEP